MKLRKVIIFAVVLMLACIVFTACKKTDEPDIPPSTVPVQLNAPTVNRNSVSDTIFVWNGVENAEAYSFKFVLSDTIYYETEILKTEEDKYSVEVPFDLIDNVGTYVAHVYATTTDSNYSTSNVATCNLIIENGVLKEHPYEIYTLDDLLGLNSRLTYYAKLMNDIDAQNEYIYPIGITDTSAAINVFTGELDGNGKTISNLNIKMNGKMDSTKYVGLFSRLDSATIKDLTLVNISSQSPDSVIISQELSVGILAGRAYNTAIENVNTKDCKISWYLSHNASNQSIIVGGLLGEIGNSSTVIKCSSNTNINTESTFNYEFASTSPSSQDLSDYSSNMYVGGLIGWVDLNAKAEKDILIHQSSSDSQINLLGHTMKAGGLIGFIQTTNLDYADNSKNNYMDGSIATEFRANIENCYALGTIGISEEDGHNNTDHFTKRIGTLIGACNYLKVNNCYTTVKVNFSGITLSDISNTPTYSKEVLAKIQNTYGIVGFNAGRSTPPENSILLQPRNIKNVYYITPTNNLSAFGIIGGSIAPNTLIGSSISDDIFNIYGYYENSFNDKANFSTFDFETVWTITDGSMPTLR